MTREAHVELWLGCKIVDRNGAKVGRIEEFEAEGDKILSVLTGGEAILQRLWGLHRITRKRSGYRIRWDQLNWSAAGPLTAKLTVDELERI